MLFNFEMKLLRFFLAGRKYDLTEMTFLYYVLSGACYSNCNRLATISPYLCCFTMVNKEDMTILPCPRWRGMVISSKLVE